MKIPNFDEVTKHYGLKTKIEFEMANYEILKKPDGFEDDEKIVKTLLFNQ